MSTRLDRMPEWEALRNHARAARRRRIPTLFARDKHRFRHFSAEAAGILLDYSRQNVDQRTMDLLFELTTASALGEWRRRQFGGERINVSEDRAVLHTALRAGTHGLAPDGIGSEVASLHDRMAHFVERFRNGSIRGHGGKVIRSVVNIGIGGSDLGPAMVCRALPKTPDAPEVRFLSNVDPAQFQRLTRDLDPETTLFIVASKTFSTLETLSNAGLARQWLGGDADSGARMARHFAAVTGNVERATAFGIAPENIFPMPDWIGGRFSLWSAIGLPIALHIGIDGFHELLAGAGAMDAHFVETPAERNLPVLMAMLGIWNRNFRRSSSLAVVPYVDALERLPDFLQQAEMESNGKRVTREGQPVSWDTCPVIWGATGTNGQHAFFQQLHQGTEEIPVDFIVVRSAPPGMESVHRKLLANAVAQSAALATGRAESEVKNRLAQAGVSDGDLPWAASHRGYPGNRPSSLLVLDHLDPHTLGALIALYEHKVFVQGVVWQICSFDQWGVELGKELASEVDELLVGGAAGGSNASVRDLVQWLRGSADG